MNIACLGHCGRIGLFRGVCYKCRRRIADAVKRGITTLAAEVEAGRLLPCVSTEQRKAAFCNRQPVRRDTTP